jgi:hypothetical protein
MLGTGAHELCLDQNLGVREDAVATSMITASSIAADFKKFNLCIEINFWGLFLTP